MCKTMNNLVIVLTRSSTQKGI